MAGEESAFATCALASTVTGTLPGSVKTVVVEDEGGGFQDGLEDLRVVAVSPVRPAGANTFALDCNQVSQESVDYEDSQIAAVAISPG
ncbi:MAG: hypothetical protein ACRDLO_16040 [Solirubrobacterales bacterium]